MAWVKQGTVPMFPNMFDLGVGSAVTGGANGKELWRLKNESTNRVIYVRFGIKKNGTSEFSLNHTPNSNAISPGEWLDVSGINLSYTAYPTASDSFGVRADAYDDYPYIGVYKDVNTAPTTPGPFTQPIGELEIGDVKTFSWGASSDPEGGILTYELSRSVNGGAFTVLGTTTNMSMNVTVPTATSLKVRVRAQDSQGAWSPYQQSDFTVTKPKYYWSKHNTENVYTESSNWVRGGTASPYAASHFLSYTFDSKNNKFIVSGQPKPTGYLLTGRQFYDVGLQALGAADDLIRFTVTTPGYATDANITTEYHIKKPSDSIVTKKAGLLIQSGIIAVEGTYPANGVHSDGYWYVRGSRVNQSIAPPGAFTAPATGAVLLPEVAHELKFGASTASGATYDLDRSRDNGATWRAIAAGVTTLTRTVTEVRDAANPTIQYRVRAKNASGVYSDYVYSEIYRLQHNTAPTLTLTTIDAQTLYENDIFAINGSAMEENSGDVVSVKYSIDGGVARAIIANVSSGSAISYAKNLTYKSGMLYDGATAITSALAEGSQHTLTVWAEDDKGGKSNEITRSFYVVPNRAATLTLDAFVTRTGLINTDVVNVSGKVADLDRGNVIVRYKIGNGAFVQVYDGPATEVPKEINFNILLSDLAEGQNAITVQAVDAFNAVTQVILNLTKNKVETPLLNAFTYYEITPPNGTTDGLQLYIERELGDLDVSVDVFMGASGTTEVFVPMNLSSTANLTNGNVEDTFSYEHGSEASKVVVRINMARTSAATNKAIKKISGVLT